VLRIWGRRILHLTGHLFVPNLNCPSQLLALALFFFFFFSLFFSFSFSFFFFFPSFCRAVFFSPRCTCTKPPTLASLSFFIARRDLPFLSFFFLFHLFTLSFPRSCLTAWVGYVAALFLRVSPSFLGLTVFSPILSYFFFFIFFLSHFFFSCWFLCSWLNVSFFSFQVFPALGPLLRHNAFILLTAVARPQRGVLRFFHDDFFPARTPAGPMPA